MAPEGASVGSISRTAGGAIRVGRIIALLAAVAGTTTPWRAAAEEEKPSIAVMPLRSTTLEENLVEVLDKFLVTELDGVGRYRVISPQDIAAMLGFEKMKDAAGCDDVTCMAELGGALGARYLMTGSVDKLGSKLIISGSLLDTNEAEVVNRTIVKESFTEENYDVAVERFIREMFVTSGTRVEEELGQLVVSSVPSGAEVTLDGESVGTTTMTLKTHGRHRLKVSLAGYETQEREVTVPEREDVVVEFALVDSTWYTLQVEEADSARSFHLTWGLVALGSAVALGVTGALLVALGDSRDLIEERYALAYNATNLEDRDTYFAEVTERIDRHNAMTGAGIAALGVSAAAATAGIALLVTMPDSFDAEFMVAPSESGASLVLKGRFD